MPSQGFQLTPEQIAKREARRAKKALEEQQKKEITAIPTADNPNARVLDRPWISCSPQPPRSYTMKVSTWNLLAQCLVRRKLFPTSECLKAREREAMTLNELLMHGQDIMCLQEVDRLEKLVPALENASYGHHYVAGPRKLHGCMIAYRNDRFKIVANEMMEYDNETVRETGEHGISFKTRNIANIVALEDIQHSGKGVIVATTHLFWHPQYFYERTRQTGLLKRRVLQFRDTHGLNAWPCILAGGMNSVPQILFTNLAADFNFSPHDPGYALLVGGTITHEYDQLLVDSSVVHTSAERNLATAPGEATETEDEEEGEDGGEGDTDRVIVNARPAKPSDGLLNSAELQHLYTHSGSPLQSAYDSGIRAFLSGNKGTPIAIFGDRVKWPTTQSGACEPQYTSYTHFWKTTLDYIFTLPPKDVTTQPTIIGLVAPAWAKDMDPGLPQTGACGSDHTSLCAEFVFPE
ncbi:hypothetical protein CYLTODRAFT_177489 [Cylindrobasidium torrendii FP15055 ss-10]|uniref:Endonuclease/exonuclease/phosphatase domain-containing protein n=1 Tax=Cylindrobasidium torrendii FP15055 ss-10 TaxID=1314674 RepID=A0A0D7AVL5_9AGAR|nr:hypothetical protein CYLTODRAFT_177489 [Cylindrobasidium torrendii FP15055 ss-10]